MKPVICTNAAPTFRLSVKVRRSEQKRRRHDPAGSADSSSRHSGTGQDSGFGSDSARIRIVQIEQQSGASHHCIARPSHKSTITKNLSFIPFDIFLTASKLSVMTYSSSSSPRGSQTSSGTPSTPEKETGEKVKAYEKEAHLHLRCHVITRFRSVAQATNQHHLALLKHYRMYALWHPVHHCSCTLGPHSFFAASVNQTFQMTLKNLRRFNIKLYMQL